MCQFPRLFGATLPPFLGFFLVILLFKKKKAPKCSAKELSNVPKHKKAVMRFMEKYINKANLVQAWKYGAIGRKLDVNESAVYPKKVSLNKHT